MKIKIDLLVYTVFLVTVYSFAATQWIQTDWSGGNGQTAWTNPAKYLSDNGNVEIHNPSGEISIQVQINTGDGADGTLTVTSSTGTNYTFSTAANYSFSNTNAMGISSGSAKLTTLSAPFASNLLLWMAADSISGKSDGDSVDTWRDLSTSGNNATQSTSSKRPVYKTNTLNGKPVLRFSGAQELSTATGNALGDFTVFVVFKATAIGGGYDRVLDKDYANGFWLGRNSSTVNSFGGGIEESGSPFGIFGSFPDNNWNVLGSIRSGTTHYLYNNGSALANNTVSGVTTNTAVYGIGGRNANYFTGDIAEILVYGTALSAEDRKVIEAYVGQKYNLSMPPYITTDPTVTNNSGYIFTSALSAFSETATKTNSAVQYILSSDNGSTWKYWTGSAWAVSNGTYSQSNPASIINTNISTLASSGTLKFKAFLHSNDGNNTPYLDNINIGGASVTVNEYTYLTAATTNAGATALSVNNGVNFSDGDEILIIQMQHATDAGTYEFRTIASGGGTNTLTLDSVLANSYYSGTLNVASASAAQVVRVPNFTTVSIQSGASIICPAWDGYTGGIIAFRVRATLTVEGSISANACGFRGGRYGGTDGYKGESYPGGNPTAIIGGYNNGCANSGRQPNGGAGGTYVNGGGGSYGTAGTDGEPFTTCVGVAGYTYGTADLSTIFLGSGGAGGHPNSGEPQGGNGGGLIWITGTAINVTGTVSADGQNAYDAIPPATGQWGAGGGSGGSIFLRGSGLTLGTGLVTAAGGAQYNGQNAAGDGGNGGSGRIRVEYVTLSGTANPSASASLITIVNSTNLTSSIYDMGANASGPYFINWNETLHGQTIQVKVRTDNNSSMSGAMAFSSADNAVNGGSVGSLNSVVRRQRYVQYQAILNTSDGMNVPSFQDITLEMNSRPDSFDLTSPVHGSELATVLPGLDWQDSYDSNTVSGDAVSYILEIDDDSNFASINVRKTGLSLSSYTLTGGEALTDNVTYYWRVFAKDNYPDSTRSASVRHFFTDAGGNQAPTLSTPLGPVNNTELSGAGSITWTRNDVDPGDTLLYTIQIDNNISFASPEISQASITGVSKALNTFTNYANLQDNSIYYWIIQAKDPSNAVSGYTPLGGQYFFFNKQNDAPLVCTSLSPASGEASGNTYLKWRSADPDSQGLSRDTVKATLEISANSSFSIIVSTTTGIAQDSIQLSTVTNYSSLNDNTGYYWRLISIDNHGLIGDTTDGTAYFYLNKTNQIPAALVLAFPAIRDTVLTPDTLRWHTAIDPDSFAIFTYNIRIYKKSGDVLLYNKYWISDTFTVITMVDSFRAYASRDSFYWQVRARDQYAATSGWSGGASQVFFFRSTQAVAPSLSSPVGGVNAYPTSLLQWTAALDIDKGPEDSLLYTLQIDSSGDFSTIVSASQNINGLNRTLSTVASYANLVQDKKYYWRVFAVDNHAEKGDTSASDSFFFTASNDAPPTPANLTPVLGSSLGASGTLSWNACADPEGDTVFYQFQMSASAGFTSLFQNDSGITSTSRTIKLMSAYPVLQDGAVYYWRVRAQDNNFAFSSYSSTNTFVFASTKPTVATDLSPAGDEEVSGADSLKWTAGADPDTLDTFTINLEVDDNADFSSLTLSQHTIASSATGVRLSSLSSYNNLQDNTEYYWRVYEIDTHGKHSDTTGNARFYFNKANNAPVSADLASPVSHESIDGGDTLKWGPATDPDRNDTVRYIIQLTTGSFTAPAVQDTTTDTLCRMDGLNGFTDLNDNQFYSWRIVGLDNHGLTGGISDTGVLYLNKINDLPLTPSSLLPAPGSQRNPSQGFSWTGSDPDSGDVLHYGFQLSASSGFVQVIFAKTGGENFLNTTIALNAFPSYHDSLRKDSAYFWRVKAYDNHGDSSAWSAPVSFTYDPAYFEIDTGAGNPHDTITSSAIATDKVALSINVKAHGWENSIIKRITVSALGMAHEVTDISSVFLYRDADRNGSVNIGTDQALGFGNYSVDNGALSFDISRTIVAGDSEQYLVSYNLNGNASDGETFTARISSGAAISAVGETSNDTLVSSQASLPRGTIRLTTPRTFEIISQHANAETAGVGFSLTLRARDNAGHIATTYTGNHTISFSTTASAAPLGQSPALPVSQAVIFTAGIGTTTVAFKMVKASASFTLSASETTGPLGTTDSIDIYPAALSFVQAQTMPGSGSALTTADLTADDSLMVYAAGYDSMGNFKQNVSVTWQGTGVVTAFSQMNDTATVFRAVAAGTGSIIADHETARDDTSGTVIVTAGALHHIGIRDSAGNAGLLVSAVGMTTTDTLTVYAAGYDADSNYLSDTPVSWSATGILTPWLSAAYGAFTSLIPQNSASGRIIASHALAFDDSTGVIAITAPISNIKIRNAAGGGGSAIDSLTVSADDSASVYCAGYDGAGHYIDDVTVFWNGAGTAAGRLVSATGSGTLFRPKTAGAGLIVAQHLSGYHDTVRTTVVPGSLSYVAIRDSAGNQGSVITAKAITSVETLTVWAAGYDSDSNYISDTPVAWSATGALSGWLSGVTGASVSLQPRSSGSGIIVADHATARDDSTGTITVTANLVLLKIRTAPNGNGAECGDTAITADDSLVLYAAGYDGQGAYIADCIVNWGLTGRLAHLSSTFGSTTVFYGDSLGSGRVYVRHASAGSDSTGDITVSAGAPAYISISPAGDTAITTDNTMQFSTMVRDADRNALTGVTVAYSSLDTLGSISGTGLYNPARTGTGRVRVTMDSLADTSGYIVISAGALVRVEISPANPVITADSSLQFILSGFDADGNAVSLTGVSWKLGAAMGSIAGNTGLYSPAAAGTVLVIGTHGFLSDTAHLTVNPGEAATLTIRTAPDNTGMQVNNYDIAIGDTAVFFAAGFDWHGNFTGNETVSWTGTAMVSSAILPGTGDSVKISSLSSGTGVLIASNGSATDSTGLITFLQGGLDSLVITPYACTVKADSMLQYSVTGLDSAGSPAAAGTIFWKVLGDIGSISATGLFNPGRQGKGRIVATSSLGNVSDTTDSIIVVPGALYRLSLAPESLILRIDSVYNLICSGFDVDSNSVTIDTVPTYYVSNSIGTANSSGLFTPSRVDTGNVLARVRGAASNPIRVQVRPGPLAMVRVRDSANGTGGFMGSWIIAKDDTLRLFAAGYDADTNYISDTTVMWILTGALNGRAASTNGPSITIVPDSIGVGGITVVHNVVQGQSITGVEIVDGDLQYLTLSPLFDTIAADTQIQFSVAGKDAHNQTTSAGTITWSLLAPDSIGCLDPANGLFVPKRPGKAVVKASSSLNTMAIFSDTLHIVAGRLIRLVIKPDSGNMNADTNLRFDAMGYDADSNVLDLSRSMATWSLSDTLGTIDSAGNYDPQRPGTVQVVYTIGAVSDTTGEFTISTGRLNRVVLKPDTAVVTADSSLALLAYGMDADSNQKTIASSVFLLADSLGSIDSNGVLTLHRAGKGLVVLAYGDFRDTLHLTVTAGRPDSLIVQLPSVRVISLKDSLKINALLFDAQGNLMPPGASIEWHVFPVAVAHIDSSGTLYPDSAGACRIIARAGALADTSDTIEITVPLLDSGTIAVTQYLSIELPVVSGGAYVKSGENPDMGDYQDLPGFNQLSPVLDFSGSAPRAFTQPVIYRFDLDSLDLGQAFADTEAVRIYRFNAVRRVWEVVFGTAPDSLHILSFASETLSTIVVGVDTAAPALNDSTNAAAPHETGSVLAISGRVTDNIANVKTAIYFRRGDAAGFDSVEVYPDTAGQYAYTLSGDNLTSAGLEYFIVCDDGVNRTISARENVAVRVRNTVMRDVFPADEYRLFSLPSEPDNAWCGRVLGSLGPYAANWRAYSWEHGAYVEYGTGNFDSLRTGSAYWLRTKNQGARIAVDSGTVCPVTQCFSIPLAPGAWTAIGNPFSFPVTWSLIEDSTGTAGPLVGPYAYADGNWVSPEQVTVLEPWQGYYVKNTGTQTITLKVPPNSGSATAKSHAVRGKNSVMLEWQVSGDNWQDKGNLFGFGPEKEYPKPPAMVDAMVRTVFGKGLMCAFSEPKHGGHAWTASISGLAEGQEYVCTVNGLGLLPDSLGVCVTDYTRGLRADLKSAGGYSFTGLKNEKARTVEILVGTSAYIASHTAGLKDVPATLMVWQNHPNPFNPATVIEYAVPVSAKTLPVSLRVFDAKGSCVAVLVDERKESGYYRAVWDSRDAKGRMLASGLYFYRVSAGSKVSTVKKMLLVK